MRSLFIKFILFSSAAVFFTACTKNIDVDIPDPAEEIVVEGYIENGTPPFVMLTRNSPYFGGISLDDLSAYFVNDAKISVWTGTDTVELIEYCLTDLDFLSAENQVALASYLGYDLDDTTNIPAICFYTVQDIVAYFLTGNASFAGEIHKTYFIKIEAENKVLTAKTYIPEPVPIKELTYRDHPDAGKNDSLASVYITVYEPDTMGNHYRYFTQRNSDPEYTPLGGSVFDDKLFNGNEFSLPVERGQSPQESVDFSLLAYFYRGDTVTVRLASIDKAHYDFWLTVENDSGDSPFGAPVITKSNISGGLGIWGGSASVSKTIIIPE